MRASKTRPIAHAVAPFRLSAGIFFRAGIIILEKSLFYKKPKSLFRTRTKYVASGLAIMVRKGLVGFYNLRVLGHFGKKGARCRDQPYGGRFFWKVEVVRPALCQKGDPLLSRVGEERKLASVSSQLRREDDGLLFIRRRRALGERRLLRRLGLLRAYFVAQTFCFLI